MKLRREKTTIIIALVIAAIVGLSGGSAIAANRLILPGGVYYHRFASTVNAVEGIWTNPAALGQGSMIRFLFIGEYANDELAKNWGGVISGDRIGMGYRRLDNLDGSRYEEYTFGTGSGVGRNTFIGGSYTYVKQAAGIYNKKHLWNVGFMMASSPQMKIGIVFSNLNKNRVDGEKTDIEELYAISYRPQSLPLWFSVEIGLSTGQSLSSADYTYGIEGSPFKNWHGYASYKNGGYFEIGLTFFLDDYLGGAQTRFNKDGDHFGTSLYGGYFYHPKDDPQNYFPFK